MAFKKICIIWSIITVVFAGLFYLIKTVFPSHPLWPWMFPYLYPGVLILFMLYVISKKKE